MNIPSSIDKAVGPLNVVLSTSIHDLSPAVYDVELRLHIANNSPAPVSFAFGVGLTGQAPVIKEAANSHTLAPLEGLDFYAITNVQSAWVTGHKNATLVLSLLIAGIWTEV